MDESKMHLLKTGDDAQKRRDVIAELSEKLETYKLLLESKTMKQHYDAFSGFVIDNIGDFRENNILLASLYAYANPYNKIIKLVDDHVLMACDTDLELSN